MDEKNPPAIRLESGGESLPAVLHGRQGYAHLYWVSIKESIPKTTDFRCKIYGLFMETAVKEKPPVIRQEPRGLYRELMKTGLHLKSTNMSILFQEC
jgi:hypothetical protein